MMPQLRYLFLSLVTCCLLAASVFSAESATAPAAILTVGAACSYSDLQTAVDAAASGDTLHVQAKTFSESVNISNKSLTIIGGYSSDCTTLTSAKSIIDGTGQADTVIEIDGFTEHTIGIENVVIRNGEGDNDGGGGLEIDPNKDVTLRNVQIYGNTAPYGGGINVSGSTLTLEATQIYDNSATATTLPFAGGGGVYCLGGTVTVGRDSYVGFLNIFTLQPIPNTAQIGGGIYASDCSIFVDGAQGPALILGNEATRGGGIAALDGSFIVVSGAGAAVRENKAVNSGRGGGLAIQSGSSLFFSGGQLVNNEAASAGGAIYAEDDDTQVNVYGYAAVTDNSAVRGAAIDANNGVAVFVDEVTVDGNVSANSVLRINGSDTEMRLNSVMLTDNEVFDALLQSDYGATAVINSTTIAGNQFSSSLPDAFVFELFSSGAISVTNSIISRNERIAAGSGQTLVALTDGVVAVFCSVLEDTTAVGAQNSFANPQFINEASGDYRLSGTSPAIDRCAAGFVRDFEGDNRPIDRPDIDNGGTYDAGADEFNLNVGLNGSDCAYTTIADALAAASDGDTLFISAGTYQEVLVIDNLDVTLEPAEANCTGMSTAGFTVEIDGNNSGGTNGFGGVASILNGSNVTFGTLTLSNGTANFGGLLYIDAASAATLQSTFLYAGRATFAGGAVYVAGSLDAARADFQANRALGSSGTSGSGDGGAIYALGANVTLTNSDILNNQATSDGGAIYADDSTIEIINGNLGVNSAAGNGGAVYAVGTSLVRMWADGASCAPSVLPVDFHCSRIGFNSTGAALGVRSGGAVYLGDSARLEASETEFDNNSAERGAAIYSNNSSNVTLLTNNLFFDNTPSANNFTVDVSGSGVLVAISNTFADNAGTVIGLDSANSSNFENNIVWNNGGDVNIGGLVGRCNIAQNNGLPGLTSDPQFTTTARGSYRLAAGSPAVNACTSGPATDMDLNMRPAGSGYDMGAFEFGATPTAVTLAGSKASINRMPVLVVATFLLLATCVLNRRSLRLSTQNSISGCHTERIHGGAPFMHTETIERRAHVHERTRSSPVTATVERPQEVCPSMD